MTARPIAIHISSIENRFRQGWCPIIFAACEAALILGILS